jgi:hypothetical protein
MQKNYLISLKPDYHHEIVEIADKIASLGGIIHRVMHSIGIISATIDKNVLEKQDFFIEKVKSFREDNVVTII